MKIPFSKAGKYILLLVIIFLLSIPFEQARILTHESNARGESSLFLTENMNFLFIAIFGAILGLESFIKERKKNGRWRINYMNLILLGIPSLIVGYSTVMAFSGLLFMGNFMATVIYDYETYKHMMQILFGYAIVTSFYKQTGSSGCAG